MKNLRKEYKQANLSEDFLSKDPLAQFTDWFNQAQNSEILEPNAFCLSTVSKSGLPSSRMVLLKEYSETGFIFYTNYQSRKGQEIDSNPHVAMLFYWAELERQVRIEGKIKKVSESQSIEYFNSRPQGAQISAVCSMQSEVIKSYQELESTRKKLEIDLAGKSPEKPQNWGGYLIKPEVFEFWQGRENRLHDRIKYVSAGAAWKIERLAP